ncbi:class I mannose-6-phosphate isomerase [Rugosimonospora africana]|uniref:Mannose-6-phosphate isomerase n=1 Tax=Rugosimonospora africana TaxID=556532 RepID=A0A8J3QU10_9ACTN|nr:class I mannose-6-phosphate isomerase [Rugosimonospora africana]GIH16529.1 mannose-6-phosphate isomerase [Rugosimonospora africana]
MQPMPLAANTPDTFYRGAGRIGRFRGWAEPGGDAHPEDWIASTTARFGADRSGMSALPDGRLLADAIAEAPEQWLGATHVARYGADPAVLVKLLDAGQRLPVHVHPDRRFAGTHLASPYGKTEAWVILEAAPEAVVYLGFRRDVDAAELAGWVDARDTGAMLDAVNRVPVRAGDAVLVPAGLPHAIGEGVLLMEVQEPTDFSVLLEQEGFPVDPASALLGLSSDLALACVDRTGWGADRVAALRGDGQSRSLRPGARRVFPEAADEFFAAELLRPDPVSVLDPGFSVVVVTAGHGVLEPESGPAQALPVTAGDTLVVPYAAGALTLRGDVAAIRARPAG